MIDERDGNFRLVFDADHDTAAANALARCLGEETMMSVFAHDTVPSLEGRPLLTMLTIIALLAGTLLALNWLHRIVNEFLDRPLPLSHPHALAQLVKALVIIGALSRSIPKLIQVMAWTNLSPWQREWISASSWYANLFWAGLFGIAWYIDRMSAPMSRWQFNQMPTPVVRSGLLADKKRAIFILGAVIVMAFAAVYVRSAPSDAAPIFSVR